MLHGKFLGNDSAQKLQNDLKIKFVLVFTRSMEPDIFVFKLGTVHIDTICLSVHGVWGFPRIKKGEIFFLKYTSDIILCRKNKSNQIFMYDA